MKRHSMLAHDLGLAAVLVVLWSCWAGSKVFGWALGRRKS